MSTATLRDSLDTVFTDGDWFLDVAFALGDASTPEDITAYDHYLTICRRILDPVAPRATPIKLSTEDGTLLVTAPNLVGPRVRAPQLQTWEEGVYDFEQSWTRPDGVTEVVFVGALRVQKGLSLGGSFGSLPIPSGAPSYTVVRSPSSARVVRSARGAAGWNGWTPVMATDAETDPPRLLMRVIDWAGGGGAKPTVGAWVGEGGLVTDPDDATDFGGATSAAAIAALNAAVAAMQTDAAETLAEVQQATATAIDAVNTVKAQSIAQTALAAAATTAANVAAGQALDGAAQALGAATTANVTVNAALSALSAVTGQTVQEAALSRVLAAGDNAKLIACTSPGLNFIYVPSGLAANYRVEVMKAGGGAVYVLPLPGSNAAVNAPAGKTGLTTAWASELLRQVTPNTFAVTNGEASAAPPAINLPAFNGALASGQALNWFA